MTVLYSNNASTTLASGISNSATTILLATGTGAEFPNPTTGQFFALTLNDQATGQVYEVCYCTARTGDSLTVTRGQEGTSAVAWLLGDFAYNALTKGTIPTTYSEAKFTTSGSFTVPTNVFQVAIELWGAGGGGGGAQSTGGAGAGGAGAYSTLQASVTPGQTLTITLGTPGAAGSSTGTNGGDATASTVTGTGISITCNGGNGGGAAFATGGTGNGGTGGTSSGGDINQAGNAGQNGLVNGTLYLGGSGGSTPFGGSTTSATVGTPFGGSFPGGGAGGAANGQNGAVGGSPYCLIKY